MTGPTANATRNADPLQSNINIVNGPHAGCPAAIAYENPVNFGGISEGQATGLAIGGTASGVGLTVGIVALLGGTISTGGLLALPLAAAAFGYALGSGIRAIMDRVQADNSTTIVVVNGVPGSTMRLAGLALDKGKLLDGYSVSSVENAQASSPTDDFEAVMLATDGRTQGKLSGMITGPLGLQRFSLDFKNPLGPRQSRSEYEVGGFDPTKLAVSACLTHADDRTRRDVVVVTVGVPVAG